MSLLQVFPSCTAEKIGLKKEALQEAVKTQNRINLFYVQTATTM